MWVEAKLSWFWQPDLGEIIVDILLHCESQVKVVGMGRHS